MAPALLATLALLALAGCSSHHQPPAAALRLERSDFVLLANTLQRLRGPIRGEVTAARAVWPTLAHGLPTDQVIAPATRRARARAGARARSLTLPATLTTEGALTGPAAGIAGLLKGYTTLTQRGWPIITAASARTGTGTGTTFLRANSGLYIYCIYDGHFDLSLIGKKLQSAYLKLGGAAAFGATLTTTQVQALASAYSTPAVRLEPHPAPAVHI
ncbi:MAG TPA: hypothetical protein VGL57_02025 [Solirubrobacteraceae bacterium]